MATHEQKLSVIVPVHNDGPRLRLLLEALEKQTLPKADWELFIVDNNSTDNPQAVVAGYPFARIISEAKPGSYAARNAALNRSQGRLLAFTDSDCIPQPSWLAQSVAYLDAHPEVAAIGGRIQVFPVNESAPSLAERYEMLFAFPQQYYVETLHYGATANMITRRECFDEVGAFDDRLKSGGDENWGQRLHATGGVLHYVDAVCICHPARTWSEMKDKIRRVARGKADRMFRKPHPRLSVLKKVIWLSAPTTARWKQICCAAELTFKTKLALMLFCQWRHWFEARCLFRDLLRRW